MLGCEGVRNIPAPWLCTEKTWLKTFKLVLERPEEKRLIDESATVKQRKYRVHVTRPGR